MARHRWTTAITTLATLTGLALVAATGHPAAFGATLAALAALGYTLHSVKRWVTDTSDEKRRLREATNKADDARHQADIAQAVRLNERERLQREVEEIRREADDRIAAADERAAQAEATYQQHAAEAKRAALREASEAIADHAARLDREFEAKRAAIMTQAYTDAIQHLSGGQLDALTAARRTVIPLDTRRPTPNPASAAHN